jgi:hypothetical protein
MVKRSVTATRNSKRKRTTAVVGPGKKKKGVTIPSEVSSSPSETVSASSPSMNQQLYYDLTGGGSTATTTTSSPVTTTTATMMVNYAVNTAFVYEDSSDDDDDCSRRGQITQSNCNQRRKAKIGKSWRRPLGDLGKLFAQNPSNGDDISEATPDRLKKEAVPFEMLKATLDKAQEKLEATFDKAQEKLEATMLYKDFAVNALKEEVATIKGKYETLASDHANVKRDCKSRINQKDEELNNSNAQITQFQAQLSTLTADKDQLALKLDKEYQCQKCVVCLDSRKEWAFIPCGHMCVCDGCAAYIREKKLAICLVCRGVSTHFAQIFH